MHARRAFRADKVTYTIGGPFQHYPGKFAAGWTGAVGLIAAAFGTSITPHLCDASCNDWPIRA
jgi:hypothetical protein